LSLRASPARWAKRLGLSLLVLLASWIAFVCLHDEALDPGFNDFYFKNQNHIPDDQNAAIGLMGLSAPIGADFMEHGRVVARAWREPGDKSKRIDPVGKLEFVGRPEELKCWVDPQAYANDSNCASDARLTTLLRENSTLVARYRQIHQLPYFYGFHQNGQLLIELNRLIVADIRLNLREGRVNEAYKKWNNNQRFLLRAIGADGTWVEKAILHVSLGLSLSVAAPLLQAAPKLATEHYEGLLELLNPLALSGYNPEGIMRAEYMLYDPLFGSPASLKLWVHPNFIRNRFYRFAHDFLRASRRPHSDLYSDIEILRRKHLLGWNPDYLQDPLNTVFVRSILGGQVVAGEMLKAIHLRIAYVRLLVLRVKIAKAGIPDAKVEAFLQSAETRLRNPFTNEPMRWNSNKRVIYFDVPGNEREPHEVQL